MKISKSIAAENIEFQKHKLWDERGYDYDYLNSLSSKELRSLFDTEFYYEA
tara:strand:- start:293 stop:445 length:153 start_codon:yes stop_codon:yes gene_type:complete